MKEIWIERNKMAWLLRTIRLMLPFKNDVRDARNENHIGVEVPDY